MDSDSYSKQQLDDLFMDMIAYYDGDPKRIQHFTKVHSYARLIGIGVRWKASGAGGTDNRPEDALTAWL